MGTIAIIIIGKNKQSIREMIRSARIIELNIRGLHLLLSNMLVPCHVLIKECPKQEENDTDNAINIDTMENPE